MVEKTKRPTNVTWWGAHCLRPQVAGAVCQKSNDEIQRLPENVWQK